MRGVFSNIFEAENLERISPKIEMICRDSYKALKDKLFAANRNIESSDIDLSEVKISKK